MRGVTNSLTEGMNKATQGLSDNTAKMNKTSASYRDVLAHTAPTNPTNATAPGHMSLLAPSLQAREGVKARQVLINIGTDADAGLPEEFMTGSAITLKMKIGVGNGYTAGT